MSLWAGCLSIEPIPDPPVNQPHIRSPAPEDQDHPYEFTLDMVSDPEVLTVIAWDENPAADLSFDWDVPHGVGSTVTPVESRLEGRQLVFYDTIAIDRDVRLDGARVTCVVSDGEQGLNLSWEVTVAQ
jgi:hypothetical protein